MSSNMTPLGINTVASLLNGVGFWINKPTADLMGNSTSDNSYVPGTLITDTVLQKFFVALSLADSAVNSSTLSAGVYANLRSVGNNSIPAFSLSKPSSYSLPWSGDTLKFGFLFKIARQAYDEFHYASGSYSDFVQSFSRCHSFSSITNRVINSMVGSSQFLVGHFSNMNDLITSDITGVSRSTLLFGSDLIKTGRAIDLSTISQFGKPSTLLNTIFKNDALSDSLTGEILSKGISVEEFNLLLDGASATVAQEKKLYSAFSAVIGADLDDVLIPLNCQTIGLLSVADLLDVKKLFPNSYISLTTPNYNNQPPNGGSKSYVLLYSNNSVNSQLRELGYSDYLSGIVPLHIELTCASFSVAMLQIKNVENMQIEKLAQSITHLENVNDLVIPDGGNKPINSTLVNTALSLIDNGGGKNGTYLMTDFFGAMSGIPYNFPIIKEKITSLTTPKLTQIYNDIMSLLDGPPIPPSLTHDAQLTVLINQANTELSNIKSKQSVSAGILNNTWENLGKQLMTEIACRLEAIPESPNVIKSSKLDIYAFGDAINSYSKDTSYGGPAQVLEKISDLTTPGGNSMIGAMREARNAERIALAGGSMDNEVPFYTETPISDIVTPNTNYINPVISINTSSGAIISTGTNVPDSNGNSNITTPVPGTTGIGGTANGVDLGIGSIITVQKVSGETTVIGSMGGSPYINLISPNLDLFKTINTIAPSVELPHKSAEEILRCYCDC